MKSYKSLNESATKSTKRELRTAIENKERLMLILDEELTYRLTFKKLNKSKAINEDDDHPLEPLSVDPTDGDDKDDYADDIYYLLEVINIEEEINRHAYQTMQLELDLVYRFVSQNHPADPMLLDIKALKERNEYTYHFFGEKYKRAMERCNNSAKYKKIEVADSLEFKDK